MPINTTISIPMDLFCKPKWGSGTGKTSAPTINTACRTGNERAKGNVRGESLEANERIQIEIRLRTHGRTAL